MWQEALIQKDEMKGMYYLYIRDAVVFIDSKGECQSQSEGGWEFIKCLTHAAFAWEQEMFWN